jgi:cobyrinic acid a,c-diamide synthase
VAVIEGNRGLFDGMDARGSYSTAELAKLLQMPVILTVDCTKATRTVAASVLGCQHLDPEVPLRGVILNQVAGPRHESVLRDAVEAASGLPVLGAIPRLPPLFPERHLGLVPPAEHGDLGSALSEAADVVEQYLDLDALLNLARHAPPFEVARAHHAIQDSTSPETVRVGLFRDAAFQFYYPENLEALARLGAQVIEVSPLRDATVPDFDALYIGGGFPETLAPALANNRSFQLSLRQKIERGLPVYAECGGTVYLGETLTYNDTAYPMAAALPATFGFRAKPQGHGYSELETVGRNPFFALGDVIRGHEFHYTYLESSGCQDPAFAFRVRRGHGFDGERDGLCHHNVLACYTHVHALGTETWAPALVRAGAQFRAAARPPAPLAP